MKRVIVAFAVLMVATFAVAQQPPQLSVQELTGQVGTLQKLLAEANDRVTGFGGRVAGLETQLQALQRECKVETKPAPVAPK